ncbi:hypothetical protein GCM10020256_52090 [Streptomyces thermocoprophilus]
MDDDHVTLLRAGRGGGAGVVAGVGQAGEFPGVPEVADAADGDQGEDDEEGDDAAAGAAAGLLAALGAVLGELQPVDDVLGVLVGLLDEGELSGVVLPFVRCAGRGGHVVLGRSGLLRDVGGVPVAAGLLCGGRRRGRDAGLLSAGGGLPVGVVAGVLRVGLLGGAVGVVTGGLLPLACGVRVVGVVAGGLLPSGRVRVVAVSLLCVRVVRLLRRQLGGDVPVDRLPVLVVADQFVLVGSVSRSPRVVSVVHR